jgi:hypothetical protein
MKDTKEQQKGVRSRKLKILTTMNNEGTGQAYLAEGEVLNE